MINFYSDVFSYPIMGYPSFVIGYEFLLTENNDFLVTENGERLILEV